MLVSQKKGWNKEKNLLLVVTSVLFMFKLWHVEVVLVVCVNWIFH